MYNLSLSLSLSLSLFLYRFLLIGKKEFTNKTHKGEKCTFCNL